MSSQHDYETKTVRIHEPDWGQYVYLMLTRFNGEDALLANEGWGGTYIWYSIISRNNIACVSDADPFSLCRRHPSDRFGDGHAARFMKDIDMNRIDWEQFSDGDKLTPVDISRMADGGDPDE